MIGETELVIIVVFAFFLFGPDKLPEAARSLGRLVAYIKKTQSDLGDVVQQEIIDPVQVKPVHKAPAKKAPLSFAELKREAEARVEGAPAEGETVSKTVNSQVDRDSFDGVEATDSVTLLDDADDTADFNSTADLSDLSADVSDAHSTASFEQSNVSKHINVSGGASAPSTSASTQDASQANELDIRTRAFELWGVKESGENHE